VTTYVLIVISCAAVSLIFTVIKAGFLKDMFSSALGGVLGLMLINLSPAISAILNINLFSVLLCTVFGIPGLISLLFMRMICLT